MAQPRKPRPPTSPKRRNPHALPARKLGQRVIASKKRYRRKDRFPDPGSRSFGVCRADLAISLAASPSRSPFQYELRLPR